MIEMVYIFAIRKIYGLARSQPVFFICSTIFGSSRGILANTTGVGKGVKYTYQYMAATVAAAREDLKYWGGSY